MNGSLRITAIETLHCAAGSRVWSYLKLVTDAGYTGWSEYTNGMLSAHGLSGVIEALAPFVMGMDPRNTRMIEAVLRSRIREAEEGINRRAISAIINACLDAHARSLDASVADLLGGAVREYLPLYWSHCGLGRIRLHETGVGAPLRTLDDVRALGVEVRNAGYRALKTNLILIDGVGARLYLPSWGGEGAPSLEPSRHIEEQMAELVTAFRDGAGDTVEVFVDINFNIKGEAVRRFATAMEHAGVAWLEVDSDEPDVLRRARGLGGMRIASGEALSGLRSYRRYFEAGAMDVPVVDVAWNGIPESVRIADLANSYDLNIAPHNYASHLLTFMNAQFAASVPNVSVFEYDVDGVPWRDEIVSVAPEISGGMLTVPNGPGWGCTVDEDAVRAHSPKKSEK